MSKVIVAENISKLYQLGEFSTGTLSQDLERFWCKMRGKEDPFLKIGELNDRSLKGDGNIVWSLKDIAFDVNQGDAVGIIGRNGAGKSTLLKILSRVTTPTSGEIKVKGRIASLLEVGTGFHPELTGRENIFLNGAILGMRKNEIKGKFDEIVNFAGVERYIDTPVKRYSSGMYVRLAFAVAAHLENEILIVDEVLAVGDAEFQRKCLGKMGDVSKTMGKTVLFVSHDLNAVAQLCSKGILLSKGIVETEGSVNHVIGSYLGGRDRQPVFVNEKYSEEGVAIQRIAITSSTGLVSNEFTVLDDVHVDFELSINHLDYPYHLFVTILDARKRKVFSAESEEIDSFMRLKIRSHFLVRGEYSITAFINIPRLGPRHYVEDVCYFNVTDISSNLSKHGDYDYGTVFGSFEWLHEKAQK